MSRPTAAPVDCRSNAGAGVVKLACHRPARSRVTLADVAAVISAHCREMRNRTHPALGTCTSPHLRLSRRTERSRMQKPSWTPALRQVGWAKWWGLFHQFWKARSRSRRAACWTEDDPDPVSYTHLRAHETRHLVCRLLLEKKKKKKII